VLVQVPGHGAGRLNGSGYSMKIPFRSLSACNGTLLKTFQIAWESGTPFVYITCSVFKEENELNLEWIQSNTGFLLGESGYVEGIDKGGDTLLPRGSLNSDIQFKSQALSETCFLTRVFYP